MRLTSHDLTVRFRPRDQRRAQRGRTEAQALDALHAAIEAAEPETQPDDAASLDALRNEFAVRAAAAHGATHN